MRRKKHRRPHRHRQRLAGTSQDGPSSGREGRRETGMCRGTPRHGGSAWREKLGHRSSSGQCRLDDCVRVRARTSVPPLRLVTSARRSRTWPCLPPLQAAAGRGVAVLPIRASCDAAARPLKAAPRRGRAQQTSRSRRPAGSSSSCRPAGQGRQATVGAWFALRRPRPPLPPARGLLAGVAPPRRRPAAGDSPPRSRDTPSCRRRRAFQLPPRLPSAAAAPAPTAGSRRRASSDRQKPPPRWIWEARGDGGEEGKR
ncbi:hypothetical protein PVAP13_6KG365706 [Panicum virgatum]|uniref:Uncharacterized protein n=1 Tax=Panicum virgatum TaxID=38727 RepID=A0A8T0RJJ7_PANVG|nr:hypothetical protein PVAP13_6KG365706 [Panicum virgatum]